MRAAARIALGLAGALAIGALLALAPLREPPLWAGLRLDALAGAWLALAGASLLALAADPGGRLLPGTAEHLALGALVGALDLRLAALAALALGLLGGWRTIAAGACQAVAIGWLGLAAGRWQWNDETLGAFLGSPQVALLLLGCGLQLGLLAAPGAGAGERRLLLRAPAPPVATAGALASLYLLLRLYELGPINWGWTLAGALAGGGAACWQALRGLTAAREPLERPAAIERAWWHAALAAAMLASEAGIAATWALALAALLAGGALRPLAAGGRLGAAGLALAALPPTLPFAALWLGLGAAQAGGLPALAACFWLIGMLLTAGAARLLAERDQAPLSNRRRWTAAALSLVLGLLLPLALARLVAPAFGQLGAGLTPFGRPVLQPWTGALVRDAGSATVAALPLLVLTGLLLLTGALSYGIFRLARARAGAGDSERGAPRTDPSRFWELVRRNLPTAGRAPNSAAEDPPRDL